ncbi:a disintegrin and metalloproteinase with thrombospondin motifs 6 [Caerostris extrusa]|uniref:A disintegrin and metalloproteinase with thrombospondin motifs 6 n=1 Tax=Caerostris extrusa TaxID=172846 RepID=A0AAV4UIL7_CAEEX|nr:a disintegrin and metalloproteinase with thrombospondin motifs 6 [Caerostris extrusa]
MKPFVVMCYFLNIFYLTAGAKLSNLTAQFLNIEIVQLQKFSHRNVNDNEEKSITFLAFGRDISLKMQEDNELNNRICSGKMYKMNDTNIEEIYVEDGRSIFKIYQDVEQSATFSILSRENGNIEMEGSIGNLQIKPVPENVRILEVDFNNVFDNFFSSEKKIFNVSKNSAHLVIKVQGIIKQWFDGYEDNYEIPICCLFAENSDCQVNIAVESPSRRRNGFEISIINKSQYQNQLIISSHNKGKSRNKIPFLEQNRLSSDQNRVNTSKTVRDFSNYLHQNHHSFRPFDIALIMTKVSQCIEQSFGRCKVHVDGWAFGTACKKNTNYHGVGLVHDFGGQKELLGALHDGSGPAANCPVKRDTSWTLEFFPVLKKIWSQCSKQQMRRFLNSPDAKCLLNYAEKKILEEQLKHTNENEGTIDNLQIKPVPTGVRIFEDDFNKKFNASKISAHLATKKTMSNNLQFDVGKIVNQESIQSKWNRTIVRKRSKRHITAVFPEILFIVDYNRFADFGYSERRVIRYYSEFLNSMDIRFQSLTNPRVKFSLSAVLVDKGYEAVSKRNRLRNERNMIDIEKTLDEFSRYLYDNSHTMPSFDIAILITKFGLCLRPHSGRCEIKLAEPPQKARADHDGSGLNADCPVNAGYIMEPDLQTIPPLEWSHCSKKTA